MLYRGSDPFDAKKALKRLEWLIEKGKRFELKEKKKIRSISQNSYLHLILTWYAMEYGETLEYIKQEVFKKQINKELFLTEFVNQKTGEVREDWRSTATLSTDEMTQAIDRFRNYSVKEAGIYLPEPNDLAAIDSLSMQIQNQNQYQYS